MNKTSNQAPSIRITLAEFSSLLCGTPRSGKDRVSSAEPSLVDGLTSPDDFKAVLAARPLRTNPKIRYVLNLQSLSDLAKTIVLAFHYCRASKGTAAMKSLKSQFKGEALAAAYLALDQELSLYSLPKSKTGEISLTKDVTQLDLSKCGRQLGSDQASNAVAAKLEWSSDVALKVLRECLGGMSTHLAKISSSLSSGGYLKAAAVNDSAAKYSVSEDDYLTLNTHSVAGSAAYAPYQVLLFLRFVFNDTEISLLELLARDASMAEALIQCLAQMGALGSEDLINLLALPSAKKMGVQSPTQVFVRSGQHRKLLTVLTPYSHLHELSRARASIVSARQAELLEDYTALNASATPMSSSVKAANLKAFNAKINGLRGTVPVINLPIGGSSPQNLAGGYSKEIHEAGIFVKLSHQRSVSRISRLAYKPSNAIAAPSVREGPQPKCFIAGASGAEAKRARQEYYSEDFVTAIQPLMDMQLAFKAGPSGSQALSPEAREAIGTSNAPWAVFVKGAPELNYAELRKLLYPLAGEVTKKIKEGFTNSYSNTFTNEFDAELQIAVLSLLALECA